MLGAIAGDIIGSVYEFNSTKEITFPLFQTASTFTDDTIMTLAMARAILQDGDYASHAQALGRIYPNVGYGHLFSRWLQSNDPKPYHSFGNGSAMRVSPIGFAFDSLEQVLDQAKKSAAFSHNHPEGIKGAQAVAVAIFLARSGQDKSTIKDTIAQSFGYNLDASCADIRPNYRFDATCQGSVPQSIICFLESNDLESAIRLAVSLGGDADTMACIAGSIAEAFYGKVPESMAIKSRSFLPPDLLVILDHFTDRFLKTITVI